MLCLLMIRYALFPPATESNKGMHTSGNSSKRAPGLKTQYTQVIKEVKVYFYPLIDPKPLPSNRN